MIVSLVLKLYLLAIEVSTNLLINLVKSWALSY